MEGSQHQKCFIAVEDKRVNGTTDYVWLCFVQNKNGHFFCSVQSRTPECAVAVWGAVRYQLLISLSRWCYMRSIPCRHGQFVDTQLSNTLRMAWEQRDLYNIDFVSCPFTLTAWAIIMPKLSFIPNLSMKNGKLICISRTGDIMQTEKVFGRKKLEQPILSWFW